MRSTTLTFRQAVYAQETAQAFIVLIEITHATLSVPIRICSGGQNITSNTHEFIFYPFELNLPDESTESVPTATLTVDNVDRQIIAALRALDSPPAVRIMVVLSSTPNTVEADFPVFKFTEITYDALTITGTISIEDFLLEPFPGDSFVPSLFPGLF
jgi:hypothetical protein